MLLALRATRGPRRGLLGAQWPGQAVDTGPPRGLWPSPWTSLLQVSTLSPGSAPRVLCEDPSPSLPWRLPLSPLASPMWPLSPCFSEPPPGVSPPFSPGSPHVDPSVCLGTVLCIGVQVCPPKPYAEPLAAHVTVLGGGTLRRRRGLNEVRGPSPRTRWCLYTQEGTARTGPSLRQGGSGSHPAQTGLAGEKSA